MFSGVNVEGEPVEFPDAPEVFVLSATGRDYRSVADLVAFRRYSDDSQMPKPRTRFDLVVEALAELWNVDPAAVLECSDDNSRLRTVAMREGEPVRAYAWVLRNPRASSSSEPEPAG